MRLPLVTIGMVTYNSSKTVIQALESCLSSSYKNFEIIIGDDCSNDSTWAIISEYNDSRIRKYKNEVNIGEYPNRNKLLNLALGEYIIYIDGDDILYPHGLEFLTKMLTAFPKSAMALAMPPIPYIVYPYELLPNEIYAMDYFGTNITSKGLADTMFKTCILKEKGGFPIEIISADTYIKKKISMTCPSVLVSNGISWWRHTPGQASQKINKTVIGRIEKINLEIDSLENDKCPLNDTEKKFAKRNVYGTFFRHLLYELCKGQLMFVLKILIGSKAKLINSKYLFHRKINKIPFDATPLKPMIMPFNKNPYSSENG
jgi:glycosyltransferase involved in cell wall biosynthesis